MEQQREPHSLSIKQGCLRYVVAALLILGVMLSYAVRGMLSVAIVAMVKSTNTTSTNMTSDDDDTCPGRLEVSSENHQDGPFDWDEQLQGEILASYFYGYVLTQFVGGWASDKFGGRVVLGPGMLLAGVLSLLCPLSTDLHYGVFMVNRALQGAFSGVVLPSTHVIIGRWFTIEERSRISGFVLSANAGGNLIALSLSGYLVDQLGWESVFYVFGTICVVFYLPWLYFVYDTPEIHPRISNEEKDFIVRGRHKGPAQEVLKQRREAAASTPWLNIMTSVPFWAAVVMMSSFLWINNTLLIHLPSYITNILHFNIKESGFISALPYLVAWLVGPVFGSLSSWLLAKRYFSQINIYRIFNGIACIGPSFFLLLVILLGCHTIPIVVCLVFTAVLQGGYYGGSVTNMLDLSPNYAGTTNGIMLTISSATGIAAPLLYGAILKGQQTLTSWQTVFYITMAMGIGPYIFFLVFGSAEEQSWNKPAGKKHEEIRLTVPEEPTHEKS